MNRVAERAPQPGNLVEYYINKSYNKEMDVTKRKVSKSAQTPKEMGT